MRFATFDLWTSAAHRRMIWGIPLNPAKPPFVGRYGPLWELLNWDLTIHV